MHELLVNRLFKLAQEKNVVSWADCPAMTIAVDLGRKATNKQWIELCDKQFITWSFYYCPHYQPSTIINPGAKVLQLKIGSRVDNQNCILLSCINSWDGQFKNGLKRIKYKVELSHDMRFPTMWYVWPAKAQTSMRIRAVWSEPLLVAWIFNEW